MNMMNPQPMNSKSAAFFQRILANQSDKRRSVNEAMGKVLSVYLPTIYEEQLNEQIDWLLDSMLIELGQQPGVPALESQVRGGRVLIVTGKAGAGKSRALAHAFVTRPEFEGFGKPGCELLSVVAPSPFTLGALGNEIARKLGYHGRREIQHSKVWPVVRELMKESGVRILHIDEAQHGDEINSDKAAQEMENTLKRMMQEDEWLVWLILSGLPELSRFCQDDDSMKRRVRVVEFEPLSFATHAQPVQNILSDLVALCPAVTCNSLKADDFAHRLLHAATYQFGILVEYVQDAIAECLTVNGGGDLGIGHFADVYTIRTGVRDDALNPFLAANWLAIPVESALYEDVLDDTGNPTGMRKPKGRQTKGIRK
ncbi:ATP-binding protein [Allomesorhizobium camelthorni]|uniref:ATP-binding protein n=1 Tax=Allomesorhizobium camelthorni TaxID=475069 RepID=A0A6G4W9P6_9HYPH|nr:ATP-binding protein [Mesorhizobium camelthorni]NGO51058.1 ATP-binding protein [Mesorhizobium camelthorni]